MVEKDRSVRVKQGFSIFLGISTGNGRAFQSPDRVFRPAAGQFRRSGHGQGVEEEKQGTMIVPSAPCGRSLPVAAGPAMLLSGRAEILFLFYLNDFDKFGGVPGKILGGFSKFGCASVQIPLHGPRCESD